MKGTKLGLVFFSFLLAVTAASTILKRDDDALIHSVGKRGILSIKPNSLENSLEMELRGTDARHILRGFLGLSHPSVIPTWTLSECPGEDYSLCVQWGDFASLNMKEDPAKDCMTFEWSSNFAREIEDCFDLEPGVHWYGGGEMYTQIWPIDTAPRLESPYIPADSMGDKERNFGPVAERYWLLSNGAFLRVDPITPLFFSLNSTHPNQVCFKAMDREPYTKRTPLTFNYEWCTASNVKTAHQLALSSAYIDKPEGIPDERMLVQPLWSTWAEYKAEIDQTMVLDYAKKVISEGFTSSSHIEVDDNWETCYGEEEFNLAKFPDPKAMIDEIHAMGMRVTAWVHPFVNYGCPIFNEGMDKGYFVKNVKGKMGFTSWWQGGNAGLIDVTNPEAAQWWSDRLKKVQTDTGLDSFKFDAGETWWLPASSALTGDDKAWPQIYVEKFADTCAAFGNLIEVRAAHLNQRHPIFVRVLDKDSRWDHANGLRALIPGMFQFGINGYSFYLPDMIGGNNYGGEVITQEFYVRWMQVNSFMPSVQFSLVPWRIGETDEEKAETVKLCLDVLAIREKYADHIIAAAKQTAADGTPMNRPLWWVDPTDTETFTIDDEYMLGDSILVAPVVHEGQTSRDIYLPRGRWADQGDAARIIEGPIWARDYPAPVNTLPFFVLQ